MAPGTSSTAKASTDWKSSDYHWNRHELVATRVRKAGAANAHAQSNGSVPVPVIWTEVSDAKCNKPQKDALMCQVEGCGKDLSIEKPYYQRYRVCEAHLKLMRIVVDGKPSRFCQQCGKFQGEDEFDGDKRSCRQRLLQHNLRRRKRVPSSEPELLQPSNPSRRSRSMLPPLKHEPQSPVPAAESSQGGPSMSAAGQATSRGSTGGSAAGDTCPSSPMQVARPESASAQSASSNGTPSPPTSTLPPHTASLSAIMGRPAPLTKPQLHPTLARKEPLQQRLAEFPAPKPALDPSPLSLAPSFQLRGATAPSNSSNGNHHHQPGLASPRSPTTAPADSPALAQPPASIPNLPTRTSTPTPASTATTHPLPCSSPTPVNPAWPRSAPPAPAPAAPHPLDPTSFHHPAFDPIAATLQPGAWPTDLLMPDFSSPLDPHGPPPTDRQALQLLGGSAGLRALEEAAWGMGLPSLSSPDASMLDLTASELALMSCMPPDALLPAHNSCSSSSSSSRLHSGEAPDLQRLPFGSAVPLAAGLGGGLGMPGTQQQEQQQRQQQQQAAAQAQAQSMLDLQQPPLPSSAPMHPFPTSSPPTRALLEGLILREEALLDSFSLPASTHPALAHPQPPSAYAHHAALLNPTYPAPSASAAFPGHPYPLSPDSLDPLLPDPLFALAGMAPFPPSMHHLDAAAAAAAAAAPPPALGPPFSSSFYQAKRVAAAGHNPGAMPSLFSHLAPPHQPPPPNPAPPNPNPNPDPPQLPKLAHSFRPLSNPPTHPYAPPAQPLQPRESPDTYLHRLSVKMLDCTPDQLPPNLRARLQSILSSDAFLRHGALRPGCVHLTLDVLHTLPPRAVPAAGLHAAPGSGAGADGRAAAGGQEGGPPSGGSAGDGSSAGAGGLPEGTADGGAAAGSGLVGGGQLTAELAASCLGPEVLAGRRVVVQYDQQVLVLDSGREVALGATEARAELAAVEPLCVVGRGGGEVEVVVWGKGLCGGGAAFFARLRGCHLPVEVRGVGRGGAGDAGEEWVRLAVRGVGGGGRGGLLHVECQRGLALSACEAVLVVESEGMLDEVCGAVAEWPRSQQKQMLQEIGQVLEWQAQHQDPSIVPLLDLTAAPTPAAAAAPNPPPLATATSAAPAAADATGSPPPALPPPPRAPAAAGGLPGGKAGGLGGASAPEQGVAPGTEVYRLDSSVEAAGGGMEQGEGEEACDDLEGGLEGPQSDAAQRRLHRRLQQQQQAALAMAMAAAPQQRAADALGSQGHDAVMRRLSLQCLLVMADAGAALTAGRLLDALLEHGVSLPQVVAASGPGGGVTLVHRCVRSGSLPMVAAALRWLERHRATWAWGAKGAMWLTPLHLAAVLDAGTSVAQLVLEHDIGACFLWMAAKTEDRLTPADLARMAARPHLNRLAVSRLKNVLALNTHTPHLAALPARHHHAALDPHASPPATHHHPHALPTSAHAPTPSPPATPSPASPSPSATLPPTLAPSSSHPTPSASPPPPAPTPPPPRPHAPLSTLRPRSPSPHPHKPSLPSPTHHAFAPDPLKPHRARHPPPATSHPHVPRLWPPPLHSVKALLALYFTCFLTFLLALSLNNPPLQLLILLAALALVALPRTHLARAALARLPPLPLPRLLPLIPAPHHPLTLAFTDPKTEATFRHHHARAHGHRDPLAALLLAMLATILALASPHSTIGRHTLLAALRNPHALPPALPHLSAPLLWPLLTLPLLLHSLSPAWYAAHRDLLVLFMQLLGPTLVRSAPSPPRAPPLLPPPGALPLPHSLPLATAAINAALATGLSMAIALAFRTRFQLQLALTLWELGSRLFISMAALPFMAAAQSIASKAACAAAVVAASYWQERCHRARFASS